MAASLLKVTRCLNVQFGSCTYLVAGPEGDEAVVIDPGDPNPAGLWAVLEAEQVRAVPFIVLTHEHFDHLAGVEPIRARFGSKLVCSRASAEAIGDPKMNMSYYSGKPVRLGGADWVCEESGWEVPWNGNMLQLLPSPGHSPGGVCVTITGLLFTGDTLMWKKKTPIHLPGGDKAALRLSIAMLLGRFDPQTLVYPGHGDSFRLGEVDPKLVLGD